MPGIAQRIRQDITSTAGDIVSDTAKGVVEAGKAQARDIASEVTFGVASKEKSDPQAQTETEYKTPDDIELIRLKQAKEKQRRARLASLQGEIEQFVAAQQRQKQLEADREAQVQADQKQEAAQEQKKRRFSFLRDRVGKQKELGRDAKG
jgi:hypothetical protein